MIGGGDTVADVGLMRFCTGGEQMLALKEYRHQNGVISRMGVAEVWIVVQKGITLGQILVQLGQRGALQMRAENVNR